MKKILILIFLMAVAAASVKAQPGVTPSITASHTSACFGTTVIVETPKAAGGLFYQFERNGSPIYPNGSPQWFAEETQQGTHTYRVRVGNTGSWSNWSDPITVTIAKTGAPVLSLIGPAKVCEGSPYGLESNYPLGTPTRFEWLDVNSGKSYQWVSNNPSIPNLPTAAGVYSFKLRADSITITGGCWSEWSNTVNVEIYPAPTTKPVINPVADVCLGNPLTFSTQVKAYPDYRWQEVNSGTITSGPNVKTITQSAAGSYTYRLRVNVHSSCGTGWSLWGDPVTAAVKNLPAAPVIAPVTNVCFGSELVFTAPQGYAKYAWTETGSGSSDTTTVNTLSKTAVGTYTYRLSVLGANGCWSNLSAAVSGEVYALPAKQTINPVADVCFGETLTLETAAGFARYGWRETTSLTVTSTTVNTLPLTAAGAYAYQVRVRDANGCWSAYSDIVNVKINDLPAKPVINPVTNVCFGSALVFTAPQGYAQYEWNNGAVVATTASTVSETAAGTYTYTVRVQDANGCWSEWSDAVNGEVYARPDKPVINPVTDVCLGATLTFETPAGFARYSWRETASGATVTNTSNTLSQTAAGSYAYQVRVQDANGCWSAWSNAVTAAVNPKPAKPAINAVADVCLGEPLTFETAAGYPRYRWRINGVATAGTNNTVVETGAGTYAYQVRVRDANNCWSDWSDEVTATVNDLPATPVIDPVANVCVGSTLVFTAPSGFVNYEWTETGSGTVDTSTVNTKSETAVGTYTYKVRVQDANGCWSDLSDEVTATVNDLPAKQTINPVADVCFGETLTLETAAGFARYGWRETTSLTVTSTTVNTLPLTAAGAYAYQVRVRDANGCWSAYSDIVNVKINDLPAKPVIAPVTNVCFGNTLVFTASQGYVQYEWTDTISGTVEVDTVNTVSVTAAGSYAYQVRVQDASGCWSEYSDPVTGEIYELLDNPVINPVTDVCFGETLTFETAAGFVRYSWRETASGATVTNTSNTMSQTAVGAYSYRVRVQDENGCWSAWSAVVTAAVNPKPDKPVINAVADVCFGDTLTFETAAGFALYRWRINGVATSGTNNTVTETAVGTYTYQVRVRNAEGCLSVWSDAVTATVKLKPETPVIDSVADVCFGDTLTFETPAGFARYSWRETTSGATVTNTSNTMSQTVVGAYSYRVRVQDENGCWSAWSAVVTAAVNPKPETPVIGRVSDVCFGDTIKFEVIPSRYALYEWTELISGTVDTGSNVKEVSDAGLYSYIVRIQNEEGCWSDYSDTVNGEIYPKPGQPEINAVSDVCFDETLTFEAPAGFERYRWQETGSGAIITNTSNTISQTAVGTYSYRVQVRNEYGCWSVWSNVVTATVNPKPETPVINAVEDVCFGETLTFEAPAGYPRYRWRINGVTTAGTNNTVTETAVGTYTYQVRVRNAEGCWSDWSDAVTATVKPKPATPDIAVTDVCFGDTLTFVTDADYPRYRWNETISGDLHNGPENSISQTAVGKYIYRVQVRNVEGCWSDYSAEVTGYVHPLPERPMIEPAGTVAICENGNITLTATSGLALYTWYLNGTEISSGASNTYSATEAGNYTVKVTTIYGCESDISAATMVEVIPYPDKPVITAFGLENGLVWRKVGMGVVFEVVNRLDTLVYQWYHNGSVIFGGQGEALHLTGLRLADAGMYSVTATTQKAQCSTASDNVELIVREDVYVHNLITPNNDGHNDNLHIRGLEIYPHNELIVINRWGNQVFNAKDYVNGTWNGGSLPDGVYFYRLKLIEFNGYTEEKTGYFHLKR